MDKIYYLDKIVGPSDMEQLLKDSIKFKGTPMEMASYSYTVNYQKIRTRLIIDGVTASRPKIVMIDDYGTDSVLFDNFRYQKNMLKYIMDKNEQDKYLENLVTVMQENDVPREEIASRIEELRSTPEFTTQHQKTNIDAKIHKLDEYIDTNDLPPTLGLPR